MDPEKTGTLPPAAVGEPKPDSISESSPRFLLVDRNGPIAEFGSWEEANKFKKDRQHHCASIVGLAKRPPQPESAPNLPPPPPAASTGGTNPPNATQESEKPSHAAESRPGSACEGGAPPANSKVMRVVGRIFAVAAKTATHNACPPFLAHPCELLVLGTRDAQIKNVDSGHSTETHAPRAAQYEAIQILYTTEPTNGSLRV